MLRYIRVVHQRFCPQLSQSFLFLLTLLDSGMLRNCMAVRSWGNGGRHVLFAPVSPALLFLLALLFLTVARGGRRALGPGPVLLDSGLLRNCMAVRSWGNGGRHVRLG